MNLIPYPFQEESIQRCMDHNTLVADECGLGKTLVAVEAIKRLRNSGDPWFQRPALIVTPKKVGPQWVEVINGQGIYGPVHILGPAGSGLPTTMQPPSIIVAHYEAVLRNKALQKIAWSIIVADEAHRIKNRKSLRTLALKQLRAVRKIALTGTPIDRSVADFWSVLNWLDPEAFPGYWAFHGKYVATERNWMGYEHITGSKNLPDFYAEVGNRLIQHIKAQVAPQLPPKTTTIVKVDLSPEQEKAYKQIKNADDILVNVADQEMIVKNVLSRIVKLRQLSVDPSLLGLEMKSGKLEWLDDYLEDNPETPAVIFTQFRQTAMMIAEKYQTDLIVGGLPGSGEDFRSGKKRLVVGTIDAMREGLNLQRADVAIFLDQHWSSILMTQAVDRIHRIDNTTPKQLIYLWSTRIDQLVMDAVEWKWSEIELVRKAWDAFHSH